MPNPNPTHGSTPVNIQANMRDVSYNTATGAWSGQPIWNIPPKTVVPPSKTGDTQTVQFNLVASAVPAGWAVSFDPTIGIEFTGVPNPWTGGAPTSVNGTTFQAADTFNNLPAAVDFGFAVNILVSLYVNGNHVTGAFFTDPDVENQSGQVTFAGK